MSRSTRAAGDVPVRALAGPHSDRAQDRRLQRGFVLLHVEGHAVFAHAIPEGNDQEAQGQPEQGDVGKDPEGVHGPRLVPEVVHGVGGDGKGEEAGREQQGQAAQRELEPPAPANAVDDVSQLVVPCVGHGSLTKARARAGRRLDRTVSVASNRNAAIKRYCQSACRLSCSSVVAAGAARAAAEARP